MKDLGWDSDSNKDNNEDEDKDYGSGGASSKVRGGESQCGWMTLATDQLCL